MCIRDRIPKLSEVEAEGDEKTGINIIKRALEEPLRTIANNAALEGSVVVERVKSENKPGFGLNALTGEYCDLSLIHIYASRRIGKLGGFVNMPRRGASTNPAGIIIKAPATNALAIKYAGSLSYMSFR